MGSRLVIESIGSEEALRRSATAEDLRFVEQFGSEGRRREVLAWRGVVRRELGEDVTIFHDEYGAPKVDRHDKYISVSHSRGVVAVLFSNRDCAVDIESVERDFCKVASRYLSDEEHRMAEQYGIFAEMWCAKEALYKYYKKGRLDLVEHISIIEYDPNRGVLISSILGSAPIEVSVEREQNLVIAVID